MAELNNVTATFSSFKRNNAETSLRNCVGAYSVPDILDGGNTNETNLSFTFNIQGLSGFTIESVTYGVLLLTQLGELSEAKNYTLTVLKNNSQMGNSITALLPASEQQKVIIPILFFPYVLEEESGTVSILLDVASTNFDCYFTLTHIVITLASYNKEIKLTFEGPYTQRSASNIITSAYILNKNSVAVSFSKSSTNNFDSSNDNISGRIYFRLNGIFVDGTQYGVTAPATEQKLGLVKLSASSFETETDPETGEVIGIIAPVESGVAATPQLVFNVLATAKNYTDEQTNFGDDFERQEDTKLYIKWIEVS